MWFCEMRQMPTLRDCLYELTSNLLRDGLAWRGLSLTVGAPQGFRSARIVTLFG